MQPGEDRVRSFHRHLADGAISAVVNLLDGVGVHRNVAEIGIELDVFFNFEISLFFLVDLAH